MSVAETRSEIRARLDELDRIFQEESYDRNSYHGLMHRKRQLEALLEGANDNLFESISKSHKAICKAKEMGEKEAYGNDPAVYYTLGVCGEAGEMANAIVKAQRNGSDKAKVLEAVKSELPDVVIYAFVLAFVLDIDLTALVQEKVDVVVKRAADGYYGGKLRREE